MTHLLLACFVQSNVQWHPPWSTGASVDTAKPFGGVAFRPVFCLGRPSVYATYTILHSGYQVLLVQIMGEGFKRNLCKWPFCYLFSVVPWVVLTFLQIWCRVCLWNWFILFTFVSSGLTWTLTFTAIHFIKEGCITYQDAFILVICVFLLRQLCRVGTESLVGSIVFCVNVLLIVSIYMFLIFTDSSCKVKGSLWSLELKISGKMSSSSMTKRILAEVSGCSSDEFFFNCLEFGLYENSKVFRETRNCGEHKKPSLFQVIL